jgi:hypothetical protein
LNDTDARGPPPGGQASNVYRMNGGKYCSTLAGSHVVFAELFYKHANPLDLNKKIKLTVMGMIQSFITSFRSDDLMQLIRSVFLN